MKPVLKRCPFCGAAAEVREMLFDDDDPGTRRYRARCYGRESHALDRLDDTEEEAIETWNQRTHP